MGTTKRPNEDPNSAQDHERELVEVERVQGIGDKGVRKLAEEMGLSHLVGRSRLADDEDLVKFPDWLTARVEEYILFFLSGGDGPHLLPELTLESTRGLFARKGATTFIPCPSASLFGRTWYEDRAAESVENLYDGILGRLLKAKDLADLLADAGPDATWRPRGRASVDPLAKSVFRELREIIKAPTDDFRARGWKIVLLCLAEHLEFLRSIHDEMDDIRPLSPEAVRRLSEYVQGTSAQISVTSSPAPSLAPWSFDLGVRALSAVKPGEPYGQSIPSEVYAARLMAVPAAYEACMRLVAFSNSQGRKDSSFVVGLPVVESCSTHPVKGRWHAHGPCRRGVSAHRPARRSGTTILSFSKSRKRIPNETGQTPRTKATFVSSISREVRCRDNLDRRRSVADISVSRIYRENAFPASSLHSFTTGLSWRSIAEHPAWSERNSDGKTL